MAQDVVRRDVKKELRNAERQQQRFAGECSLGTVLEVKATSLSAASSIFAYDNGRMPVGFPCRQKRREARWSRLDFYVTGANDS